MASYYDQVNSLSPRVWYRFNETAGTPTNSGGLSTTATFNSLLLNEQTDVDGRATYFDGTDSYIRVNTWPAFSLFDDKSFTIETWFKLQTQDANDRTLFHFGSLSSYIRIQSLGTANANSGKIHFNITGIGEQSADRSTYTTNNYFDNSWHHAVITINTTSAKFYIDGSLIASKTLTTGTLNFDNLSTSPNNWRVIGSGISLTTGNLATNKYRGWLDEFAIYNTELTAAQVLANFNAGASVDFADTPGTASSLFVMPAFSVETVLSAAPMTASAASGDHYNSTVEFPTLLNTYMSGLTLQTWFKFDKAKVLTDYGTEPTRASSWGPLITNNPTGGIQGFGEVILTDDANTVNVLSQVAPAATGIAALLNDEDFTIGFWTKKLVKEDASIFTCYKTGGGQEVNFRWNADGGISFIINHNSTPHSVASTTDITDGEWHFVVGKLSSNTMQLWIDNVSIGTTSFSNNLTLDFFQFETGTTDKIHLSQFFVTTAAAIGTTEIANIWDYGTPTTVSATAYMPEAAVKFNSAFNDYIQSKNPILDFRLDEGSGSPVNFGSASIALVPYLSPQGFTQGEVGLNTRAFKFTDRTQATRGNYNLDTGTFSTDDLCTIGILFKSNNATNQQGMVGFGGRNTTGLGDGNGFSLLQLATSGYLRIVAGNNNGTVTSYTGTTNYADGNWHLAVIVKEASTVKLYVDGKQHLSASNSTQMSDSGEFIINGTAGIVNTTGSVDKLIDEVFVTNTAFTAQEVFEAWQKLRLEMDTTASASLPMPTNIAGTGTTQTVDEATASSLFEMPTNSTDQVPTIDPATASALFVLPNFGGNVVIDANYGHEAFTASAVFHEPQFQIGDIHSADHMNASALMVHPVAIAGGSIAVSTAVGSALFVMPGIVTIKGARIFADPMRAQSLFPLPPAYIQLTDDPWFVRLYEAHADRKTEPKQASVAAGSESTEIIKGGFLAFFDDHLADRSPTSSPNTITSELPAYFFNPISSTGAVDTTKGTTAAIAPRQSNNPAPLLAIAGQDNQERKAVRVNNIEFVLPGTSKNFSERYYNLEFSIKTTKADQVLSYGQWESFQNYGSRIGVIGLSDGKIYLATDDSSPLGTSLADLRRNIPSTAPHPKNLTATNAFGYFQGRNNIADGNWHHVVIQYGWTDGRTQIWVDGNLDRQIGVLNELGGSGYATFSGSNGTNEIRPYILGFNSNDPLLYSDFIISAWNFFPGRFLEQRDINLNYTAYGKWEPIKAEPMTASVATPQNHRAAGNRARALMLYFWPVERQLGTSKSLTSTDNGQFGAFDEPTFENFLTNVDRIEYQGWDLFPVDVIGTRVSPMIKPEVWGGYGYRDQITGAPRYLDLVNDIDLSLFDAIFFRNFPEQTEELDEYVRQEFSDTYFNVKEADLYENFLASLRAAVDQGLSLYVTNSKLALDLGIVDRVEVISDISEGEFAPTSTYVTSQLPADAIKTTGEYTDTHRNNRFRVVNTLDGLTNEESYIWKDWMYFESDDQLDFGGPNRPYASVLHRPNGLQAGDEFVNASATLQRTEYEATPFANVKAGKIITAFSNTIKTGSSTTDNPYRNYATCIAVEPGTILNGKATGGKIFVNFTERLQGSVSQISGTVSQGRRAIYSARDITGVDLNQDKWINLAYNQGEITLAKKNELLAASGNLDRLLEAAIAAGNSAEIARINQLKYWDSNGINILASKSLLSDTTGSGDLSPSSPGRTALVNKTKKSGDPGTGKVTTFGQWFTFEYGWLFPRLQVATVSMLTRGFRWLSDRIVDEGLVNRVQFMNVATSELVMPVVTADKDRTVYATSMLANATIIHAPGYALADVSNTTLPLTATAKFGDFVKNIVAEPFIASALIRQPRIAGIEEDEIVVYINHVDPILYLREDIIK